MNINLKKNLIGYITKKSFSVTYPRFDYPFYPINHSSFKSTKAGLFN
jgi:hypothetical protein